MIITAYSTRHHGYTAYCLPLRGLLSFGQLTGYHSRPQDAIEFARSNPGEMIHSTRVHDSISIDLPHGAFGTVTGRWSSSRPEPQDLNHRQKPKGPMVNVDFTEVEKRTLAHYSQGMTATQAAEARDKFDKAHPKVKAFWDDIKPGYFKRLREQQSIEGARSFASLYMQEPMPVDFPLEDIRAIDPDDKGPMAAREDEQRRTTGRRGLYTEDQREALRSKASQRRPKKS